MRSRRRLQWALAVLAAVPLASASREIVLGPQGVPGGSPDVTPTVDSALRYANVFKFAVGPVIWSQLGHVERSPGVTYALSSLFVGGFARIRSWQQRGRPHPITVGAVVLEIAAPPLLIAWQRRIRTHSSSPAREVLQQPGLDGSLGQHWGNRMSGNRRK